MVFTLAQLRSSVRGRSTKTTSSPDEDSAVDMLRSIPRGGAQNEISNWAAAAADVLTTTTSNRIRNAAALALADLGAVESSGRIVEVLRRPEVAKASGTLIYALSELGARLPLSIFVGLIENGSFESRAAALALLDEDRVEPSNDADVDDALTTLGGLATEKDDPEGAEAALFALKRLRDKQWPRLY